MVNRPEWIDAMFAIMKIGAVLVPVNTRFRTEDMAYILAQSDAAAVILADRSGPVDYLGMLREVVPALGSRPDPRFPCLRGAVVLSEGAPDDVTDWRAMLDRGTSVGVQALPRARRPVDPDDTAFIFYTSGTTGFPKGAVHRHRMIRNAWDHGDRMGLTAADVILMYLPLFHAFGFIEGPLMSMVRGARQVLTETFEARALPRSHRAASGRRSSTASTRTSRSCWMPRSGSPATCRACAPASAAPAWRARSRSPAAPAGRSGTS